MTAAEDHERRRLCEISLLASGTKHALRQTVPVIAPEWLPDRASNLGAAAQLTPLMSGHAILVGADAESIRRLRNGPGPLEEAGDRP